MQSRRRICDLSQHEISEMERQRKLAQEASELLKRPMPDTFFGRKTQEPFPKETTLAEEYIVGDYHR